MYWSKIPLPTNLVSFSYKRGIFCFVFPLFWSRDYYLFSYIYRKYLSLEHILCGLFLNFVVTLVFVFFLFFLFMVFILLFGFCTKFTLLLNVYFKYDDIYFSISISIVGTISIFYSIWRRGNLNICKHNWWKRRRTMMVRKLLLKLGKYRSFSKSTQ